MYLVIALLPTQVDIIIYSYTVIVNSIAEFILGLSNRNLSGVGYNYIL